MAGGNTFGTHALLVLDLGDRFQVGGRALWASHSRGTGGVLDYRIEWNPAAQFLIDTTVDHGALDRRSAIGDYHEQVDVGLGSVIASDARPEGIDALQASVDSDAVKPCSDRHGYSRQCLSRGCIHERALTIRITAPARPGHTA